MGVLAFFHGLQFVLQALEAWGFFNPLAKVRNAF